jgi:hypothetical protein
MNNFVPALFYSQCSEENYPNIGQTGSDHKTAQPVGVGKMAFMNAESPAFLVGKKCFDAESFRIIIACLCARLHICDQIYGLFVSLFPVENHCHRPVFFISKQNVFYRLIIPGRNKMSDYSDLMPLIVFVKKYFDIFCSSAYIQPSPSVQSFLKISSVKLSVSQENNLLCGFRYDVTNLFCQGDMAFLRSITSDSDTEAFSTAASVGNPDALTVR